MGIATSQTTGPDASDQDAARVAKDTPPSQDAAERTQGESTSNTHGAHAYRTAEQADEEGGVEGEHDGADDEDDDENRCAFCRFMKGGGCGAVFRAWEKCVDTHRSNPESFAEMCMDATKRLQECMEQPEHREYYAPMLEEEAEFVREQTARQQEAEAQQGESQSEIQQGSGETGT